MQLNRTQILEIVNYNLPMWIKKDKTVKDALDLVISEKFATKKDTNDRFAITLLILKFNRNIFHF